MEFHDRLGPADEVPDLIYITSLFTYSWSPVHEAAAYYRALYPNARIVLGGIYATLMPEHARLADVDEVHTGLVLEAERFMPDYSLTPEWKSSIMFGTRGCIRKCAFCAVPRLEGKVQGPAQSITDLVHENHRKVVLWDNNILGVPNWEDIVDELRNLNVTIDFNQGLDARLINEKVAQKLKGLRIRPIRMAYDMPSEKAALKRAIPALDSVGFSRRSMHVYTLYNFMDTPEDFLDRVRELLSWGVVSYPMRYEPLNSLVKNKYISPHWTPERLELLAKARRVLGFGGAFPPYEGLVSKLKNAETFEEAFSLRPNKGGSPERVPTAVAGQIQELTPGLTPKRGQFRELLNDPATLQRSVTCGSCGDFLEENKRAFALQDYTGQYVGYVCPPCHPNRKWINALWRSVFDENWASNGKALNRREVTQLPANILARTVH